MASEPTANDDTATTATVEEAASEPVPETAAEELSLSEGSADHSLAEWEKAAAAVLRKSGRLAEDASDSQVWDELTTHTLGGVAITPLGLSANTADVADAGLPGQSPFTRGSAASREFGAWDIRAHYRDPDRDLTAEHVLDDLENGVNSVWLSLGPAAIDTADLPDLLEKVFVDLAPVIIDAPGAPVEAAQAFADLLADRDVDAAPGTNLGANPIGQVWAQASDAQLSDAQLSDAQGSDAHADERTAQQIVADVAHIASQIGSRALVVDGTDVHDAGASDVQELAYSLAVGVAYLRMLVSDDTAETTDSTADATTIRTVDDAAGLLEFRFAATDNQFVTIAKFRAARRLWNRVAELSGASPEARGQRQHAVTSRPMMAKYDSHVNMVRTTIAAFAAGVGGADAVTVLPFDAALGLPEKFSRRIARNTSSLLISESHVAKVTDPAGGAYAVEKLTDDLARAAWQLFGQIEEAGGIFAVLADGSLHAQIAETAKERTDQIGTRERPLTGISEYPNLDEVLPERRAYPEGTGIVARYSAPFERLRDDPPGGHVFLATLGTLAAHTARASFITNLFAAGGIAVESAGATAKVDDVIAAYDGSPVVCLAGSDKDYAAWGADLATALRGAGAQWIILAGKPADGITVDGITVDDTAARGVDALDFLHRTRDQLGHARTGADA